MIHLNHLLWIEEHLPPEVESKTVRGGMAYYFNEKQVMILTEDSKTTEYKGKKYPFELWFGVFFLIEKIKQSTVAAKFPFLENHPGNKKALYLPAETEEFETLIKAVLREIFKGNPLFGEPINETAVEKRARINNIGLVNAEVNTKRPSLFNTGPIAAKKKVVTKPKISSTSKKKSNKKSENSMILEIAKRRS